MKSIFFLSTGRTGSTKLGEILRQIIPVNVRVDHQTRYSHIFNILGSLRHYGFPVKMFTRRKLIKLIPKSREFDIYINTDPLLSFALESDNLIGKDNFYIHLVRSPLGFVESYINWQFTRCQVLWLIILFHFGSLRLFLLDTWSILFPSHT